MNDQLIGLSILFAGYIISLIASRIIYGSHFTLDQHNKRTFAMFVLGALSYYTASIFWYN